MGKIKFFGDELGYGCDFHMPMQCLRSFVDHINAATLFSKGGGTQKATTYRVSPWRCERISTTTNVVEEICTKKFPFYSRHLRLPIRMIENSQEIAEKHTRHNVELRKPIAAGAVYNNTGLSDIFMPI
jgi:hypothetical protein